ncbi:MAG: c-type cytochrome [Saprospiraceae bacterium]
MKYAAPLVFLLLLGLVTATQQGCYYDNEVDLYGTACDTVGVRYSSEIQTLLANNCTTCHSPAGNQEPYLDNYANVKTAADEGKLVGRTNDASAPMPPTGLMPDCNRDKIRAWVNAGAPNN